jgi:hypothetical protein
LDPAITNGKGCLFVQTLLPSKPQVRLIQGVDLYTVGGKSYPPKKDTGPAPECRIEVSPSEPAAVDYFLHVLTATEATVAKAPQATVVTSDKEAVLAVDKVKIGFGLTQVGGWLELGGKRRDLAGKVVADQNATSRQ